MTDFFVSPSAASRANIPSWPRYRESIAALPNLMAWFNGNPDTVYTDDYGRVIQWNSRGGPPSRYGRPDIYPGAGSPLFVRNAYRDRNAIRFTRANQDVMQWSGQRAIGRSRHTSIIIADLKPAAVGVQYLIGDSTPAAGQHILALDRRADGGVFLGLSAGPNGSVGIIRDITPFVNVGRPMLIIASVDGFFNTVKLKINRQDTTVITGDPTLQASDVYIGASGYADSARGCDMDLFDHIPIQNDLLAGEYQGHQDAILSYAYATFDIL